MNDEEINVMQLIRKAAGVDYSFNRQDMPKVVADLKKNSDRYEKIRKITPMQFSVIYQRNLEFGIPFDELIDGL